VLTQGLVDVLSVNENELQQLAADVKKETGGIEGEDANPLFEAASFFSMLGVRVDLHTTGFSATFIDGQRERALCASTNPVKVTGAGDAWNAGDIFAQGMGLEHRERLVFANATAAACVRRADVMRGSRASVFTEYGELG